MFRSLVPICIALLATACASPQYDPLTEIRKQTARELQRECRAYYLAREPRLVYPDPTMICSQLYGLALRGESVGNWRL
ncbi:MAG: hypothetical protein P8Y95_17875 [Gammaproteobacteria bacterium]|jgi:hypothetical protein